jgi:hypothetical protein
MLGESRLKGIERGLVTPDVQVGCADKSVPVPSAPPLIRVADFLGVAKPDGLVKEHPEGAIMAVRQSVQGRAIIDHAVERGLPRIIGQGRHAFRVLDDPRPCFVVDLVDRLQRPANDIGFRGVPVDGGRQVDALAIEI